MMKCESCNCNEVETTVVYDAQLSPMLLCAACEYRLLNKALRPSEFFHLAAIHGHCYYLHDDFYDDSTGEATQPRIEVTEADKFPFPKLEDVKTDLPRLIDFAF